jgi:hypothetical protein
VTVTLRGTVLIRETLAALVWRFTAKRAA